MKRVGLELESILMDGEGNGCAHVRKPDGRERYIEFDSVSRLKKGLIILIQGGESTVSRLVRVSEALEGASFLSRLPCIRELTPAIPSVDVSHQLVGLEELSRVDVAYELSVGNFRTQRPTG